MGQKLLTVKELEVFRIKTMRELLASLGILPLLKKEMTAWVIESPIVGQNSLQNSARKSSGLGAFMSYIWKSVSLIFSRVGIFLKIVFSSSNIQWGMRLSSCSGKVTSSSINIFFEWGVKELSDLIWVGYPLTFLRLDRIYVVMPSFDNCREVEKLHISIPFFQP